MRWKTSGNAFGMTNTLQQEGKGYASHVIPVDGVQICLDQFPLQVIDFADLKLSKISEFLKFYPWRFKVQIEIYQLKDSCREFHFSTILLASSKSSHTCSCAASFEELIVCIIAVDFLDLSSLCHRRFSAYLLPAEADGID